MPLVYRRVRSVMGACVLRAWRAFSKRCSAHGARSPRQRFIFFMSARQCSNYTARFGLRSSVSYHKLPRAAAPHRRLRCTPRICTPIHPLRSKYRCTLISTRLVRPREWCTESVQRARYRLRTGTPKRRPQLPTATLYSTATSATVRPAPPPIAESASGIMPRCTSNNMW